MGASAKAVSGVAVEAGQSGMLALRALTQVTALPAGLTTAIPASATTGMRLVIVVQNHTAVGTLTITGTAPLSGAAVSETSYALPVAERPGEPVIYTTSAIYGTVDAAGISATGLTNGSISVFGIQGARRKIVGQTKYLDKVKEHSPIEERGSFDEDFHLVALNSIPEWDFSADFYPDNGLWLPLGAYSSGMTVTPVPNPGTVLLAATAAAAAGSASLTTQPTAPGMVLQITLGGAAPASAATVSVTGVNQFGETVTEIVVPSTKVAGVYTSSTVFTSVAANGVSWGAFGAGVTVAISGFFGWIYSGLPGDTLASFALENYDSTGSFAMPYALVDEWTFEAGQDKEAKITAKGPCQAVFPVGDPSQAASQITAFADPLDDPIVGWKLVGWIDPLGATPGTTQQQDLIDLKLIVKVNQTPRHTSWGNPPSRMWNRAYRKRRKITFDVTLDMTQVTYQREYMAFKQRRKRLVKVKLVGPYMGTVAGQDYYLGMEAVLPLRWLDVPERDFTPSKESVELKLKGTCEFEAALGYSHQLTWFTRIPLW